jgi:hypothetical protein
MRYHRATLCSVVPKYCLVEADVSITYAASMKQSRDTSSSSQLYVSACTYRALAEVLLPHLLKELPLSRGLSRPTPCCLMPESLRAQALSEHVRRCLLWLSLCVLAVLVCSVVCSCVRIQSSAVQCSTCSRSSECSEHTLTGSLPRNRSS